MQLTDVAEEMQFHMGMMSRRYTRALLAAVSTTLIGVSLPSAAVAANASSGSLSMTSEEGDWVGDGQQYSYSTEASDTFAATSFGDAGQAVDVEVYGANGDWWRLEFRAPQQERLVPGSYSVGARSDSSPYLSVAGNGRSCGEVAGSFVVSNVTYDDGRLKSFDATFEQQCVNFDSGEPSESALRGAVHVVNPTRPAPLQVTLKADANARFDRTNRAFEVTGTVTCSRAVDVSVLAHITQPGSNGVVREGNTFQDLQCSSTPTRWRMLVSSFTPTAFNPGVARLDVHASGYDAQREEDISAWAGTSLRLTR